VRILAYTPNSCKEAFTYPGIEITDAKVRKVAQAILGIASFFVATTLLGYGGIIALLSLPLYYLSIRYIHFFFQRGKYDDEKNLEHYRQKALEETFAQTHRLHGLPNLFQYNILQSPQLENKLQTHLTTLNPEAVALLYHEFKILREDYESFSEIFEVAMNQAMADFKASELFENSHINILLSSDLVSDHFISKEKEYRKIKRQRAEHCKKMQSEFSEPFLSILEHFEKLVATAKSNDNDGQAWLCKMRQEIPKLKRMKCAAEALPEKFSILQSCPGNWDDIDHIRDTHERLLETFYDCRKTYQNDMNCDQKEFAKTVGIIDSTFE